MYDISLTIVCVCVCVVLLMCALLMLHIPGSYISSHLYSKIIILISIIVILYLVDSSQQLILCRLPQPNPYRMLLSFSSINILSNMVDVKGFPVEEIIPRVVTLPTCIQTHILMGMGQCDGVVLGLLLLQLYCLVEVCEEGLTIRDGVSVVYGWKHDLLMLIIISTFNKLFDHKERNSHNIYIKLPPINPSQIVKYIQYKYYRHHKIIE